MTTTAAAAGGHRVRGRALREVIIHRPGTELERLTPANAADLLFDDVMWPERARNEHDGFAEVLRDHGARVHLFCTLLAEALATAGGREFAIDQVCTDDRFGPTLASELRAAVRRHRRAGAGRPAHRWRAEVRPEPAHQRQHDLAEPGHRRLPARAVAEHAVPARQRRVDRARRHHQPDGQAGPPTRVDQHPNGVRAPSAVRRRRLRDLPRRGRRRPHAGDLGGRRHPRPRFRRGDDRHG